MRANGSVHLHDAHGPSESRGVVDCLARVVVADGWLLADAEHAVTTSGGSGGACPDDVDDLSDAALADLVGPGFVAAVAMVHRFVDSPDPQYRGYDISITTRIAGLAAADQVMFVSVDEPLPAITLGKDAIVVGVRGPRPLEISPYDLCPPLVPLAP
jgi:hypothetical protein